MTPPVMGSGTGTAGSATAAGEATEGDAVGREETGRDGADGATAVADAAAHGEGDRVLKRPLARAPEPAFFWLRYAPRGWPPPPGAWTDLARGGLGPRPGDRGTAAPEDPLPDLEGAPLDDVVWLPPVPVEKREERDRVALRHLEAGTPVLLQVLAGEAPPREPEAAGAVVLHDLLPVLLAAPRDEALEALGALPAGAAAVWPLVPGCTDDPGLWRDGCAALARAGVAVVQTLVPRLAPADRRWLAEAAGGDDDRLFHGLFHGGEPDEAGFARIAAAAGLEVFLPRPLPRPPATGQASRRIAAAVFLVADLWLRLGRPPSQGQAFFRAARWIDDSGYDPEALAREGNLGVVAVIGPAEQELIEDAVARDGTPALLTELLAEYAGDAP